MKRLYKHRTAIKIALVLIGISISFLLGEIGLRVVFSYTNDYYYVWPPKLQKIFKPNSDIMPGIEGESRFLVNSKGIRGDDFSPEDTYRILVFGGSTTENTYLDQSEAWPYLLQEKLNNNVRHHKLWVGNVGKSGITTRHHILQMRYLLQQYPRVDAIIILVGINDLAWRLVEEEDYDPHFLDRPDAEDRLLFSAFSFLPLKRKGAFLPYYKRMALWHMTKRIKYIFLSLGKIQDTAGEKYVIWRRHRREAKAIRDTLPDMSLALEEYSRNIDTIIDLGKERSIRLIFLTQPALWKKGLSGQLNDLLWLGGVGNFQEEHGKEYYSVEALEVAMRMYNETLLEVCRKRQVECIDLASFLPKDTTVFYDDCHFNEMGNQKVAEILAQYMLQSLK